MTKNIEVKQNTRTKITFQNPYPEKQILKLKSSCSCSKPTVKNNTIQVMFKSSSIPYHLSVRGYYFTTSYVTVIYQDGNKKLLYIKAKIIR